MWKNQDEDTDHNSFCQNWAALNQLWIFAQAVSQTFKTCSHLIQLEIMLWVLNLTRGHPLLNRKLAMNGQVINSN